MSASPAVRSGLVLGAGGVLGGAWMAGALHALAERTRWYPRHAEYIVGTSAGSVSLFLAGMRQGNTTLLKMLCGLAPVGVFSTDPIKDTVRWVANDGGWVQHPNTWIVACDYQTGDRVVFGKEGAPEVDVAQAVAASCAIPGYYRPEE